MHGPSHPTAQDVLQLNMCNLSVQPCPTIYFMLIARYQVQVSPIHPFWRAGVREAIESFSS